ncbi:MAG TPA: energy transducer TonB [Candidatus Dormibacteraeota bacterium]|nr:energy transducer TonB [Candidatus Dormibacteraeota bacterium]
MIAFVRIAATVALLVLLFPSAAQQPRARLPRVIGAAVPFYPRTAPSARIQGIVTLQVSTNGTRVSSIDAETGPAMLVQAARENMKTWEFEPHSPTSFEVTFHYKLLLPKCDSECRCDTEEKESVLLQLPTNADVSAKVPAICDPAVPITGRNRSKRE